MYAKFGKRLIDIVVSFTLLVILSIPIVVIAFLIKLTSPGPAFFRQERTGIHGKNFTILKFRSMTANNDVHDRTSGDVMTPIGRVLRKLSLDELPQLINILHGNMSFIGPRPWIPEYYKLMSLKQRKRYSVRPGLTGLAQAYGRNGISIFEKIAYDLQYVRKVTLLRDVKVILVTVRTITKDEITNLGKGGIHDELDELRRHGLEG